MVTTLSHARYDPATATLGASAIVGFGGKLAGGRAGDPIEVTSGDYAYSPDLSNTILTIESSGDFVGVDFSAAETANPVPLWSLAITAAGQLQSASDLLVAFSYDSSRLTIVDPDPGNPAPLEEKIESRILSSFDFSSPGTARRLNPLVIFDGTYHVSATVEVEAGLGAGALRAPALPAASVWGTLILWLILFGTGAVALLRKDFWQRVGRVPPLT